jgi:arsenate reductase
MAEAIVNALLGDQWVAVSAGTHPAGYIHSIALEVLKEIGIDHLGTSKSVNQYRNFSFDLVVTLCDDAVENCPVWLGKGKRVHMGFLDPAKAQGSNKEILSVFRAVRDDMLKKVLELLKNQIPDGSQGH